MPFFLHGILPTKGRPPCTDFAFLSSQLLRLLLVTHFPCHTAQEIGFESNCWKVEANLHLVQISYVQGATKAGVLILQSKLVAVKWRSRKWEWAGGSVTATAALHEADDMQWNELDADNGVMFICHAPKNLFTYLDCSEGYVAFAWIFSS
ncbi:hypothetical protein VNO77_18678 [Canavalia gladiata]|uniref:Uncharacterized protein n=1 Tax=Canavalia gladiata TaxID=3824 RepID=A0AAN9LPQ9_CANGL